MKHMDIWDFAEQTDPKYTKPDNYSGFTTINGTYLIKKATELFGPMGLGWGFDIIEERYDEGVPFNIKDVGLITSKSHTIKLELWYKVGDEVGKVVNFGHTKYVYKTKNGYMLDEEAPKKSLTDAIKKCLSMLGFSGDIFMGQFEDREYMEEITRKSQLEHADDKDAERLRQIKEHKDWMDEELKCYALIDDAESLEKVYIVHMRKCGRRNDEKGREIFTKAYESRLMEIKK